MPLKPHPTDPDKMTYVRHEYDLPLAPRLDQGADYERGFIDGMQHQMRSSVDRAVNRMSDMDAAYICHEIHKNGGTAWDCWYALQARNRK